MYTVRQYTAQDYEMWNNFVSASKNGTFSFYRDFMEYHADRFTDFSLLVFDGQKLLALLPANRTGEVVHSHQGLTYGGLVFKSSPELEKAEQIFNGLLRFLKINGISALHLKQPVSIYHKQPSFETDYLLFNNGARLYRRDMNLAVPLQQGFTINPSKLKHFRRAVKVDMQIRQDNNFHDFWDHVLVPRLQEKHNVKPVHTSQEISLLHDRFPENILQCNVYFEDTIVAGITLFKFDGVIKSQYGATTAMGEKLRALDYLFISLIEQYKGQMLYFDMGTVTENVRDYNKGLIKQKEELGCQVFLQDFYELKIDDLPADAPI